MDRENYRNRIRVVEKEMAKERNPKKKARLNKYKQKLEIQYRDFIRGEK